MSMCQRLLCYAEKYQIMIKWFKWQAGFCVFLIFVERSIYANKLYFLFLILCIQKKSIDSFSSKTYFPGIKQINPVYEYSIKWDWFLSCYQLTQKEGRGMMLSNQLKECVTSYVEKIVTNNSGIYYRFAARKN